MTPKQEQKLIKAGTDWWNCTLDFPVGIKGTPIPDEEIVLAKLEDNTLHVRIALASFTGYFNQGEEPDIEIDKNGFSKDGVFLYVFKQADKELWSYNCYWGDNEWGICN